MNLSASTVTELISNEIARISLPEIVSVVKKLQVETRCELREWDYGEIDQRYPCWIVIEHKPSNTCVCYCEEGFGPPYPWGLLFISGPHMSMGTDSQWFRTLEDAVRNSAIWKGENPPDYEVG